MIYAYYYDQIRLESIHTICWLTATHFEDNHIADPQANTQIIEPTSKKTTFSCHSKHFNTI